MGKLAADTASPVAGEAVLFSAHLDRAGHRQSVNGDAIYNGAGDDAAGCAVVLRIARAFAQGERPKRTLLFAFFTGEERIARLGAPRAQQYGVSSPGGGSWFSSCCSRPIERISCRRGLAGAREAVARYPGLPSEADGRNGMEIMILSLNAPAIQAIPDPERATEVARRSNDFLAARCEAPAALPGARGARDAGPRRGDARAHALREGAGIPRRARQRVLADQKRIPWFTSTTRATAASGRNARSSTCRSTCIRATRCRRAQIYEGHPWLLGPTWAFGQETAVHALRLMASGLFDAHPRLQIILGHLGEGLPLQHVARRQSQRVDQAPPRYPAKRSSASTSRKTST